MWKIVQNSKTLLRGPSFDWCCLWSGKCKVVVRCLISRLAAEFEPKANLLNWPGSSRPVSQGPMLRLSLKSQTCGKTMCSFHPSCLCFTHTLQHQCCQRSSVPRSAACCTHLTAFDQQTLGFTLIWVQQFNWVLNTDTNRKMIHYLQYIQYTIYLFEVKQKHVPCTYVLLLDKNREEPVIWPVEPSRVCVCVKDWLEWLCIIEM